MATTMTRAEVEAGLTRLAPFHHRIELPYGLTTHDPALARRPVEFTRVASLVKHAFPALLDACGGSLDGRRVLDIACNCGGFSIEAAKRGADYVLGFDIVDHYIEQAEFVKNALSMDQLDFRVMDLELLDESVAGTFDVTLVLGIMYHFENPVNAMRRIAAVTEKAMLIDTRVLRVPRGRQRFFERNLWDMRLPAVSNPDSVDFATSRWRSDYQRIEFHPTETAVIKLARTLGFSRVEKIEPRLKGLEKRYYTGRRASFIAVR